MTPPPVHPIATAVLAAAAGRFPPVDGAYEVVTPWKPGIEAIVAFTGHAMLALDPSHGVDLDALGVDGFGGAHHPRVIVALAGPGGWIDSLDVVLAAPGTAGPGLEPVLVERPDLADHPRAVYNAGLRDDLRVFGRLHGGSLVTIGRGLGGLAEVGIETDGQSGAGVDLLRDVAGLVPAGDLVVAAVAPGNTRALRSFLAAGFAPVASVQLFRPTRAGTPTFGSGPHSGPAAGSLW